MTRGQSRMGRTTQVFNSRMNSNMSPVDDYNSTKRRKSKKSEITLNAVRVPERYRKSITSNKMSA